MTPEDMMTQMIREAFGDVVRDDRPFAVKAMSEIEWNNRAMNNFRSDADELYTNLEMDQYEQVFDTTSWGIYPEADEHYDAIEYAHYMEEIDTDADSEWSRIYWRDQ